jgi:hypothetical protein
MGALFLAPVSSLYATNPIETLVDTIRVVPRDTRMRGASPQPVLVLERASGTQVWLDENDRRRGAVARERGADAVVVACSPRGASAVATARRPCSHHLVTQEGRAPSLGFHEPTNTWQPRSPGCRRIVCGCRLRCRSHTLTPRRVRFRISGFHSVAQRVSGTFAFTATDTTTGLSIPIVGSFRIHYDLMLPSPPGLRVELPARQTDSHAWHH